MSSSSECCHAPTPALPPSVVPDSPRGYLQKGHEGPHVDLCTPVTHYRHRVTWSDGDAVATLDPSWRDGL
jgi:hypothetical protein